ncbi:hypothetical protein [Liquorilactobacillus satsumensis]|uniref:hypothetical protein n=1 Tax=Liquorilactobacillus satsumensis TaxID=259059 RepID=UPI0039E96E94
MAVQNKKNNRVEAIIPINKKRKKRINLLLQDAKRESKKVDAEMATKIEINHQPSSD